MRAVCNSCGGSGSTTVGNDCGTCTGSGVARQVTT